VWDFFVGLKPEMGRSTLRNAETNRRSGRGRGVKKKRGTSRANRERQPPFWKNEGWKIVGHGVLRRDKLDRKENLREQVGERRRRHPLPKIILRQTGTTVQEKANLGGALTDHEINNNNLRRGGKCFFP